jgi:hypothetical protein
VQEEVAELQMHALVDEESGKAEFDEDLGRAEHADEELGGLAAPGRIQGESELHEVGGKLEEIGERWEVVYNLLVTSRRSRRSSGHGVKEQERQRRGGSVWGSSRREEVRVRGKEEAGRAYNRGTVDALPGRGIRRLAAECGECG